MNKPILPSKNFSKRHDCLVYSLDEAVAFYETELNPKGVKLSDVKLECDQVSREEHRIYAVWYEYGTYADDDPTYKMLMEHYTKQMEEYKVFIISQYNHLKDKT